MKLLSFLILVIAVGIAAFRWGVLQKRYQFKSTKIRRQYAQMLVGTACVILFIMTLIGLTYVW
ncbi:hypothetical protein [Tuberibacillus sp. Marseille-P3662]|uniref:hypothetical protein n=1 Tax=Tuberibacillus sp. Marseille-P3662 TaxID=1965358 RepID=UPI000A1CC359|nr:hypothetical protein [Tuberibacillus sp. Marseille-P3662]